MSPKRITVLLLAAASSAMLAQADTYAERYLQQTGPKAVLYTGNGQARYPFRPENSYFLFGDAFRRGDIVYNGIFYSNVLMNVDAYQDLLYVKSDTTSFPILMETDKVSSFIVNGHAYVRAEDGIPDNDQLSGYVEKLLEADSCILLKKTQMVHYETTEGRYVSHHFEAHTNYYLLHGRKLDKIRGKATFTKAFPDRKKALNATWKQLSPLNKNDADDAYKMMFKNALGK